MQHLRIHELDGLDHRLVRLAGELDLGTVSQLDATVRDLRRRGHARILLDLSALRLCDAAAMTELIRANRAAEQHGGWVRLAAPTGMVAVAFAIVGLGREIAVYATVAGAALGDASQRIKD